MGRDCGVIVAGISVPGVEARLVWWLVIRRFRNLRVARLLEG